LAYPSNSDNVIALAPSSVIFESLRSTCPIIGSSLDKTLAPLFVLEKAKAAPTSPPAAATGSTKETAGRSEGDSYTLNK